MIKDIAVWRIIYYIVTYFVGSILGYFIQIYYYKDNRWNLPSGLLAALFLLLGISMICVIISSPRISIIAGFVLAAAWGTCGYWGVMLYLIRRKRKSI